MQEKFKIILNFVNLEKIKKKMLKKNEIERQKPFWRVKTFFLEYQEIKISVKQNF
jgi:hypothetical protein